MVTRDPHREALAQGLPLVASAGQHQTISAIMATAVSVDAGNQHPTPSEGPGRRSVADGRDNKKRKVEGAL